MITEPVKLYPEENECVNLTLSGGLAREFVRLLNANKIRDGEGNLVVFSWFNNHGYWSLQATTYTPDHDGSQRVQVMENTELLEAFEAATEPA